MVGEVNPLPFLAPNVETVSAPPAQPAQGWVSRRVPDTQGHALTYVGLLLFTMALYYRPNELFPGQADLLSRVAFVLGLLMLMAFFPSQLILERRLTARPREIDLVLLLCLAALISVPMATNPGQAWAAWSSGFIRFVAVFIVMVNVVRTERRLLGLWWLALSIGFVLSINVLHNYSSGKIMLEGYRSATGLIGGVFGDPNDLSLYLLTITPLAVALLLSTGNRFHKILYGTLAVLMIAAAVVTFSRGGFLVLVVMCAVLAWKFGRRNLLMVAALAIFCTILFFALVPARYSSRMVSILNPELDQTGSATNRRKLLIQSATVALSNPVFGVGMNNFGLVSFNKQQTHNAYTQVASEIGVPALVLYMMFILVPLGRLRQIERETFGVPQYSHFYYGAVGLQMSLIGYMVGSFFLSVAYYWFLYYLVGYAVCLRRIYETGPGRIIGRLDQSAVGEA
jgi:probable O-glycosylation ligase (exosortase A-associated)